jgi:acetate kinase
MSTVLALNVGSSSLKFGLYDVENEAVTRLFDGQADTTRQDALTHIQRQLQERELPAPTAIGHRIVHGGPAVRGHCRVDADVLARLRQAGAFAPLHVPPALDLLERAGEVFPGLPSVACLDTAFHAGMPEVARTLPLPREIRAQGIERYGFHGLSCESIVRALGPDLPSRVVVAHLGNGASITAIRDARSIDTSMGLTPSGGIVMGTRPGDLDPGIAVWLMRERGMDADAFDHLINHEAGLRGLSGQASDMRQLHAAVDPQAALAIAVFVHSARKQIAAMGASLGGIDLLVFTGGIGEHDHAVREDIVAGLRWLGLQDMHVAVVPSREDEQIALNTWDVLYGV